MARGMLGRNSPIHIRQNRRDALKEADLVILAGKVTAVSIENVSALPVENVMIFNFRFCV